MVVTVSILAHLAACLAYAVFAGLLRLRGKRSWLNSSLIIASAMTALWALLIVLSDWSLVAPWMADLLGPLRDGAWFAVVLVIQYQASQGLGRGVWLRLVAGTALVVLLYAGLSATAANLGSFLGIRLDATTAGIMTAILGLILVENMLRNLTLDQFWGVKLLGIGLLAVLAFQFFTRLPQFLTSTPTKDAAAAEALVFLIILPLFVATAARNPNLHLRLHSSRKVVFHTAALMVIGVLLQGTALAAYYVRTYGGDNADAMSIVFGFGALVAIAVAVASGRVRSRLRMFIAENFFSLRYDYRLEWEKFIRALSARDEGDMPLRVLRTLADLLDSTGGALWVWRERWQQFMPVANWSFRAELAPLRADDPALSDFADESCAFLEPMSARATGSALHWQQRHGEAWLAVPLRYRSVLVGVAVINRPRAERALDWEDKNLIALVALQLAAYLVQEEMAQALADARQLEEFNKRFAFILHDTKNTIGQLSLLVRNAEQFGHEEEFRKDMIVTLRHAVEKLQELLAQLKGTGTAKAKKAGIREAVDIAGLVASLVEDRRRLGLRVTLEMEVPNAFAALADEKAFLRVLEHVLANAIEATPKDKPVTLRIRQEQGLVRVSVEDKGRGMTPQFIADELFRPLRTTKEKGFGIGAYQAREIMRELGGDIEVRSKIGEGTSVILSLPAHMVEKEVIRA